MVNGDQNVECLMPGVGLALARAGTVVCVRESPVEWKGLREVRENSGLDTGLPRFQDQTSQPVGTSLETFQREPHPGLSCLVK